MKGEDILRKFHLGVNSTVKLIAKTLIPPFLLPIAKKVLSVLLKLKDENAYFQVLYKTGIGRKIFWNRKAIILNERYGDLKHDYEVLSGILTTIAPIRLFDCGCGSGRLFPLYQDLGIKEIFGQDISKESLNLARAQYNYQNIKLLNTPAEKLNFPDSYFSIVICNRILQHIPPDSIELTVKSLCRLGMFIYVNEITDSDGLASNYYCFMHDYINLFEKFGFFVKDEGFIISEVSTQQKWLLFERCPLG